MPWAHFAKRQQLQVSSYTLCGKPTFPHKSSHTYHRLHLAVYKVPGCSTQTCSPHTLQHTTPFPPLTHRQLCADTLLSRRPIADAFTLPTPSGSSATTAAASVPSGGDGGGGGRGLLHLRHLDASYCPDLAERHVRALLLPPGEDGAGGGSGGGGGGGAGVKSGAGGGGGGRGQLLSLVLNGCDAVSDVLFREEEGEGGEAADMSRVLPSDAGASTHPASSASASSLRNFSAGGGGGLLPLQSLSLVKCGRLQSLALGLAPKPGWSAVPLFTPKQLHLQGPRGGARPGSPPSLPPSQQQQRQPEEVEAEAEALSWCSVPTRLAGLTTLRLSLSNVQVGLSTRGATRGGTRWG